MRLRPERDRAVTIEVTPSPATPPRPFLNLHVSTGGAAVTAVLTATDAFNLADALYAAACKAGAVEAGGDEA